MYLRRIQSRHHRWYSVRQPLEYFVRSTCNNTSSQSLGWKPLLREHSSQTSSIKRHLLHSFSAQIVVSRSSYSRFLARPGSCGISLQFCAYSSKGDGRNASENKHLPETNGTDFDKRKESQEKVAGSFKNGDSHSTLGEQDQMEWLDNEKLAIESRRRESPFLTRREKFKNEFLRRIIPWENINIAWDTFPYYINEHTKNLLKECSASHIKNKKLTASYGAKLTSSSGRILLQSVPGSELYRERLVKALARELKVPLLVLDGSTLVPYDFSEDVLSESESDDENGESEADDSVESEVDDENDASNEEEWNSSSDAKSEGSDNDVDVQTAAEIALKKLVPFSLEDITKGVPVESESDSKSENAEHSGKCKRSLKKGDRVRYVGASVRVEADNRALSNGQRGEIYEVNGDRAAVILDIFEKEGGDVKEEKGTENNQKPPVYWIHVKDIEHDQDAETEDCYVAMEALWEVLHSNQPLIVYFPDSSQWLSRGVRKSNRKEFVNKVQHMFDQLSGPVVLICGQNKGESGSKEKEKFTMILPNIGRLAKLPLPLKHLTDGLQGTKRSDDNEIFKLFDNVLSLHPPKEEDQLKTFNKQVNEDRKIVTSRGNINELHRVLEEHGLSCTDLLHVNTEDVILTKRKAEKVVGWAKNHYLSSCLVPSIRNEKLCLPRESVEIAILRLREQDVSKKPSQNLKNLAKDEYETNFVSAVVPPGEIGVRFDDVGALEDVKRALNELVILPMKRPELFSRGNLLQPCKGVLLFGPPGTGKTLLAKALATEAGANFISITGSTLTSKWFGDAEKLTKALFSFASKLAPVIIFVDEVDSLLGARGGGSEHEATRRMRNEFMAAWDGLRSKESERILILGATNRPFDLDDAVIRRLPRRIYVDLPDSENRLKILRIILGKEHLEPDFQFENLASLTEGYSGSDLKNLCIAAAYRPVQELIEAEKKGMASDGNPELRPLNLDDFVQSKSKVGPSVAYDAASMNELRKWNEQYGEGGSRRKSPFGFGN